jgi:hypothetical protein
MMMKRMIVTNYLNLRLSEMVEKSELISNGSSDEVSEVSSVSSKSFEPDQVNKIEDSIALA